MKDLTSFHHCILTWYENNARQFPWRQYQPLHDWLIKHHNTTDSITYSTLQHNSSQTQKSIHISLHQDSNSLRRYNLGDTQEFHHIRAYCVWISEIMLQQTQAQRVLKSYYFQFLEKFPTLQNLACAEESEVLKAWQGLGYYSRARNLKKTAEICMQKHAAMLPYSVSDLKKLPGIGDYTAGAIACFGWGQSVSFLDSNIIRLLSRLFALEYTSQKTLQNLAQTILNHHASFQHNQALIDLGAMICLPQNPRCIICPIVAFCQGSTNYKLYGQTKKIQYESKVINLLIITRYDSNNVLQFALMQSQEKLYKNLYGFFEISDKMKQTLNHCSYSLESIGEFKHSYTRFKLQVYVYCYHIQDAKDSLFFTNFLQKITNDTQIYFVDSMQFENLALSNLTLKAFDIYQSKYSSNSKKIKKKSISKNI